MLDSCNPKCTKCEDCRIELHTISTDEFNCSYEISVLFHGRLEEHDHQFKSKPVTRKELARVRRKHRL